MKKNYILDACALIAALKQEDGAMIVDELYSEAAKGNADLIINKVNLLEVYYNFYREDGKIYADTILKSITKSIVIVSNINFSILKEAGRIKTDFRRISLADSIALAETVYRKGYLVTADHHEMDALDKAKAVKFCWIR